MCVLDNSTCIYFIMSGCYILHHKSGYGEKLQARRGEERGGKKIKDQEVKRKRKRGHGEEKQGEMWMERKMGGVLAA